MVGVVRGVYGQPLTVHDLPPAYCKRWSPDRKATVVIAIRSGLITLQQAEKDYFLGIDEYLEWQRLYVDHGKLGLRITCLGKYRRKGKSK